VALVLVGALPPESRHLLRAAGGLLLLLLAAVAVRDWRREPAAAAAGGAPHTLWQAVLINLLNPNPYLAWTFVLGPAAVAAWRRHPAHAAGFVLAFYGTMLATLAASTALAGTTRRLDVRRRRALQAASALLLAALGAILLAMALVDFFA
jgi:threonine/homoserine/homoserine lactone efflux protein